MYLARSVVVELCLVLRFKSSVPERSLLMMAQLALSDCGAGYLPLSDECAAAAAAAGNAGQGTVSGATSSSSPAASDNEAAVCFCRRCWVEDCKEDPLNPVCTAAAECMRAHLSEIIEYIADAHTISKVKVRFERHLAALNLTLIMR